MAAERPICRTCKHWYTGDGSVSHHWYDAPEAVSTNWRPDYLCHVESQELGECRVGSRAEKSGPWVVGTCQGEGIYGEVITDARFGCILHEVKDNP